MNTFQLIIQTPLQEVFNEQVESCHYRALDGDVQILAKHTDLTSAIKYSHVKIKANNFEHIYLVNSASLSFDNKSNTCHIMALRAVDAKHIDKLSAKEMLQKVESKLHAGHDLSKFKLVQLENLKVALQEECSDS